LATRREYLKTGANAVNQFLRGVGERGDIIYKRGYKDETRQSVRRSRVVFVATPWDTACLNQKGLKKLYIANINLPGSVHA